ncbi:PRC-barrel domain-containing protein [Candidatus Uhrbacteria bacterium]|nr:PRC-barrel domain-containing protein [Candidatus Uhrbacteria bacterium]
MLLSVRQLITLPVVTRGGVRIGWVLNCLVESETQTIIQYEVRRFRWWGKRFLIHRHQVVNIEADRLVVEDELIRELSVPRRLSPSPVPQEQTPLSSQNDSV